MQNLDLLFWTEIFTEKLVSTNYSVPVYVPKLEDKIEQKLKLDFSFRYQHAMGQSIFRSKSVCPNSRDYKVQDGILSKHHENLSPEIMREFVWIKSNKEEEWLDYLSRDQLTVFYKHISWSLVNDLCADTETIYSSELYESVI